MTPNAGCPDIQFLPTRVMDDPKHADDVLEGDGEVDGYLLCIQGLGWRNDIVKLCGTGKPTLVVDNLFGGSGLFLTRLPQIMAKKQPVDWVSSSDDRDIVASTRKFSLLKQGKSAAEVAAKLRDARRGSTPHDADWTCKDDRVAVADFDSALQELKRTRILVVGDGWGGDAFRKAAAEVVGVTFVPIAFEELSAFYATVDRAAAVEFAERWSAGAQRVVEPARDELEKSGAMYVAMKKLMDTHGARGISINCLGGFYGGHMGTLASHGTPKVTLSN